MDLLGVCLLLNELNIPLSILDEDNLWSISLSNDNDLPISQKRHIIFSFDGMTETQKNTFQSLDNITYFEIRCGSFDVVSFDAPEFTYCKNYKDRFIYHKLRR